MNFILQIDFLIILLIFINYSESIITFEQDITLSANQKEILDKFKKLVIDQLPHDFMKEDIYLIKWLKIKNFNIDQAKTMLFDNLKWREEQQMDTIQEEDWSDFDKDYMYWMESRDKYGRPVLYFDVGSHDVRKAVISGRTTRYLRYADKGYEEFCTLVRTLGEKYGNITRGNIILDFDGFNLVQHSCLQCVPVLIRMLISAQTHYPLCIDQAIFVNAPTALEPLLNTFRAILEPELSRSIQIFGTNKKMFQKVLAKDYNFDELPPSLGGTKIYKNVEQNY